MKKKARKTRKKSSKKADIPSEYLGRNVSPVALKLPIAYLAILTKEAERAGLRRGHFLAQLLQRKRGEINIQRPDSAPTYEFKDEELKTTKLWVWYMSRVLRQMVDSDRLQMGVSTISTWVTQLLNDWIGKQRGLRS